MVQSNSKPVHKRASTPALISRTIGRFQGTSTFSSVEQGFITNDLENLRKNSFEKGISNMAPNLISVPEDWALQVITNGPGKNELAGVVNNRLIRLHVV